MSKTNSVRRLSVRGYSSITPAAGRNIKAGSRPAATRIARNRLIQCAADDDEGERQGGENGLQICTGLTRGATKIPRAAPTRSAPTVLALASLARSALLSVMALATEPYGN
jgi:hypothetical protein